MRVVTQLASEHLHGCTEQGVCSEICEKNPEQTDGEMRTQDGNRASQTGEKRDNGVDGHVLTGNCEINSPTSRDEESGSGPSSDSVFRCVPRATPRGILSPIP